MLVVTVTAGSRSLVERIPEEQTRIAFDPAYYRDVRFTLEGKESLAPYREHFIYGYLEQLWDEGDLPGFILKADSLEIEVRRVSAS